MKKSILIISLIGILALAGCSNDSNEQATLNTAAPDKGLLLDEHVTLVEGEFGSGSMYRLYRPDDWNGDLLIWTHGYAFPQEDPALPDIELLQEGMMAMGYGVAYSSYSETGWAVHVAMNESRQLRGLFAASFDMPDKTYLMGVSMGGLIATALAERNPNLFDGVVPMCGALGGTDMAADHVFTVRALFDYFYPGALPGNVNDVPESLTKEMAAYLTQEAILANPMPAMELAGVHQSGIQYASAAELVETIVTGVFFHVGSFHDFLGRTHGHDFFDNGDVMYTGSADDAALNAGIVRSSATKDAEQYMRRWYEPTGKLKMPLVSIHTTRDPVVPIMHQDSYAAAVDEAGYAQNMAYYEIDRFGHCTFTPEEMLAAFMEMVAMVEGQDVAFKD